MWLIHLAWKNIWRNKTRTIITMAAVFFAVILSVFASSIKDGVFDNLVKNVVSFYTGYVQIHKAGYFDEQILDNSMELRLESQSIIQNTGNVSDVAQRLESYALIASSKSTKGCMVVGIEPEKETKVTRLKEKIVQGTYLEKDDEQILLSEGLSERINAGINDTIYIIGQGYHGATAADRFTVKGIVKFGSPDLNSSTVFLSLKSARALYSADGLTTTAVISLKNPSLMHNTVEELKEKLEEEYEVLTWEQIIPEVKQHIETDTNNMKYIQGILYLLVSFGIFGTLLMMMVERKYEIGMLIAIGMQKSKLCIMVAIESILTVLGGCILGILASIPVVYYFHSKPIRLGGETAKIYEKFGFEAIFPTSVDLDNFIMQGYVVLSIGLVLSLYPVYKVLRTNPVTSMKR